MIDGSDTSIRNLKLILYCFEWLSRLKINFHKSEVYVFGTNQAESYDMANKNCVLGELPLKYLGIPVSDKHLNVERFSYITNKMLKRLDPWKGKHITSGGCRQILTNSCLSSIPMYCMSFYDLQGGVHAKIDGIRSRFLWQGAEKKFRYHMAKFEMVCRPNQGGLGVINTTIMNECLLVKWIWKIHMEPNSLWFKILKAKYMKRGGSLLLNVGGAHNFGKDYIESSTCSNGGHF